MLVCLLLSVRNSCSTCTSCSSSMAGMTASAASWLERPVKSNHHLMQNSVQKLVVAVKMHRDEFAALRLVKLDQHMQVLASTETDQAWRQRSLCLSRRAVSIVRGG